MSDRTPLDAEISAAYEWARTSGSDVGWQAPKVAEFCLHRTSELRAEVSSLESQLAESKAETQDVYEDYQDAANRLIAAESRLQAVTEALQMGEEVQAGLDSYCGLDGSEPYEGGDCPHEFIGLELVEKWRKTLKALAPPTEPTERKP